jgi:hypothetical protein
MKLFVQLIYTNNEDREKAIHLIIYTNITLKLHRANLLQYFHKKIPRKQHI